MDYIWLAIHKCRCVSLWSCVKHLFNITDVAPSFPATLQTARLVFVLSTGQIKYEHSMLSSYLVNVGRHCIPATACNTTLSVVGSPNARHRQFMNAQCLQKMVQSQSYTSIRIRKIIIINIIRFSVSWTTHKSKYLEWNNKEKQILWRTNLSTIGLVVSRMGKNIKCIRKCIEKQIMSKSIGLRKG